MVIREKTVNEYGVYHNGESIGTVVLSHNPYHKTNCYVKLDLNYFDPQMSKELFAKLKEIGLYVNSWGRGKKRKSED